MSLTVKLLICEFWYGQKRKSPITIIQTCKFRIAEGLLLNEIVLIFWHDPIIAIIIIDETTQDNHVLGLNPLIKGPVNKTYKWFVKCNLGAFRIFMSLNTV